MYFVFSQKEVASFIVARVSSRPPFPATFRRTVCVVRNTWMDPTIVIFDTFHGFIAHGRAFQGV